MSNEALEEIYQHFNPVISNQIIREVISVLLKGVKGKGVLRTDVDSVIQVVEQLRLDFKVLPDSSLILDKLITLYAKYDLSGKKVHDANIVATMLVNNIEYILTHNEKDFKVFEPEIKIIPLT